MKIQYSVFILASLSLSLFGYTFSKANVSSYKNTEKFVTLTNKDRAAYNLNPLRENKDLDLAAQLKIDDMAANNYFAHISPQGTTPWYFIKKSGYDYSIAGENLALNFGDPAAVENAWIKSTEHRENILNPKFAEIGIAQKEILLQGQRTNVVVEYFGNSSNFALK